jgi:DNA-binding transcriptional MerR regulator
VIRPDGILEGAAGPTVMQPGSEGQLMRIGELARHAGVSVRAIRYYEELGILRPRARSRGGFRLFGPENTRRLAVIQFLKQVGLPLEEIRQIFLAKNLAGGRKDSVDFLLRTFRERLKKIEAKVRALDAVRAEISGAIEILRCCEACGHEIILDAAACHECGCLADRDRIPDTFKEILH